MCHGKLVGESTGDQKLMPIKKVTVEKIPNNNEC